MASIIEQGFDCNKQAVCQLVVQEKLQQAESDKEAKAQSAQAEADHLQASVSSLNTKLAEQKQLLDAQEEMIQLAYKLRASQIELKKQLGEQKKLTEAKEELLQKRNGGKDEQQQQQAASMKTRLAEVWDSFIYFAFCCSCAAGLVAVLSQGIPSSTILDNFYTITFKP